MYLSWRAAALVALGLVPTVIWPGYASVRWWWLLCLLLVALDVGLAPSPRRLVVVRKPEGDRVRLGEPLGANLLVTNPLRRRVTGRLRDAWQPSAGIAPRDHRLRVRAGERVRLRQRLVPTRRGDVRADRVTVRTGGPLGLAGRQHSRELPGRVRALHPFPARRHVPSRLAVLRQLDGRAAIRTRGQGTEFDSLRDYVDGDDVRSIDWRATARRRNLVVRTWQPEQHKRIIVVVDASRTSAGRIGDVPRLDSAMDAALLLVALAGHARDRVEVVAGDQEVRVRTGGAEGTKVLADVIHDLAPVHPVLLEASWPRLVSAFTGRGNRRGLVVLLTALEPAAVEEGLLPVLPALVAHHRVVVASVADPSVEALAAVRGSAGDAYAAAAAERTLMLRRRTATAIERLGASVVDASPDELPPRLADHYLMLKRHGLL